jgi:hypothetical protein
VAITIITTVKIDVEPITMSQSWQVSLNQKVNFDIGAGLGGKIPIAKAKADLLSLFL